MQSDMLGLYILLSEKDRKQVYTHTSIYTSVSMYITMPLMQNERAHVQTAIQTLPTLTGREGTQMDLNRCLWSNFSDIGHSNIFLDMSLKQGKQKKKQTIGNTSK